MKCSYIEDIINYDEGSLSIERSEEIKKHIKTCEECRKLLGSLMISRKYIVKEPKMDEYFYMKVINAVDSNRYKRTKLTYKLLSFIEKQKPILKASFGVIAVVLALVMLTKFSGMIGNFSILNIENTNHNNNFNSDSPTNLSFLQTKGQNIVTADGKAFNIRAVTLTNNFWGNWINGVSEKLQEDANDPVIRPLVQDSWVLTEDDFKRIKNLGCNTVLYDINYQLFAKDNPNRLDNMEKLKNHIRRFSSMNIYTAIMLMAPPGLDSTNDIYEMYKPGTNRVKSVFEDDAYYSLWIDMWKYLANELKDFRGVAGYGLINQPRVPSNKEGGIEIFKTRLNNVCKEIRKIDKKHLIFIPEYNSREANPGESYWDNKTNSYAVDNGEQAINWERGLVKVNESNIVYLFQFFEPYNFVNDGIGSFDPSTLEAQVKNRSDWAKDTGHAPLLTEYGISRVNKIDKRQEWLDTVHTIFNKYGISASYFHYKTSTGAYVNMETGYNPIYGEYTGWKNEITLKNGVYSFLNEGAAKAAKDNHFIEALENYYLKDNKIEPVSMLDNQPLLNSLQKFWK